MAAPELHPAPPCVPPDPAAGRRLPVGAEVVPGGVHFRVWAPSAAYHQGTVWAWPVGP